MLVVSQGNSLGNMRSLASSKLIVSIDSLLVAEEEEVGVELLVNTKDN